jgi:hypothetical protein
MNSATLNYLPKFFTRKAIGFYFAILICSYIFFPNKLPILWITFGLVEVISFFYFSNLLTRKWALIPDHLFQKRLFITSLLIRISYIVLIYFFYLILTGNPFEFDAGDSTGYHGEALWIIDMFKAGHISEYFAGNQRGFSDRGYPLILAFIYLLTFNSILTARILIGVLSAWMCVVLYKLASRTFGLKAGRITAIMAMLLPTLIYYSGLHTKETLMIFILVAFTERADFLLRSKTIKPGILIQVVLLGVLLFFFRTVLAIAAWFALFSALLFSAGHLLGSNRRATYIIWFAVAAFFILSGRIFSEVKEYVAAGATNQSTQMQDFSTRSGGNKLSTYGSRTIFLPLMIVAPFPTMVNIEGQSNTMMINGSVFDHNIYAFFVILALLMLYKNRMLSATVFILAFIGSYLFILASSGFALSERFHVPVVPFLLILAGYGVTQLNKRNSSFYLPYLVLIAIVIIGWNWFKMAGRGVI